MDPLNAASSNGKQIEWKKKALERSYHAGQRYYKHLRKINKFAPRLKARGDTTKSNDADSNKSKEYVENDRLNSLVSVLAQRSDFGITMEEDDDISDGLLTDGLVEAVPEDSVLELTLPGLTREEVAMSPKVLGCVTIDGFAFRTFPAEGGDDTASAWIKEEQDQDVKPSVDELNRVRYPTKTTDFTKIKGWRNKAFAENDEFVVKQESEENGDDANNSLVDVIKPLNSAQSVVSSKKVMEKSTLLNCALTLPYDKTRSAVPVESIHPKKKARLANCAAKGEVKNTKKTSRTAVQRIAVTQDVRSPIVHPIVVNPARKPKTKAEYRRMLEAARSVEANIVDEAPVTPLIPEMVMSCQKKGRLPKSLLNITEPLPECTNRLGQTESVQSVQNTGRIDKRLKAYRDEKAEQARVAKEHNLDLRYMYAMIEGRPIKIVGSVVGNETAGTKMVNAEKPVKTSPTRTVDPRYLSLLAQSETLKPSVPKVKHRNRGRPLSKKIEAKEKRLQQFCLRVHPAIGFPLTESAFNQICLLRDDQMDVNEDWINFATTVINSKKKTHYHRKGFVDKVVATADVLLPVRVTSSGKRYESGNMENFKTIKVPTAEVGIDESNTYLEHDQNIHDEDADTAEIRSLLCYMVDSVTKQAAVEDLHLLAEPKPSKESSSESHDFLNPMRTTAHPRKRRSALDSELRRLNVLVIKEREADIEELLEAPAKPANVPACKQEHCKFGCLCLSLERSAVEASHCGRPDCMFECVCGGPSGAEEHSALPKSVVSKINESTKYLARTEKEFQRAVVCNKNEMLVVDGCAAPATGRRKREVKLPLRFRESGIDDKILFGGNANLEVIEARKNERKVEEPQSRTVDLKPAVLAEINEDPTFGLGGRPFFVPNHVKTAEFFRRRLENRISEQRYAKRYRLRPSKVVIYRAKLENVEPFCIVHDIYKCPCLRYISSCPAVASHDHPINLPQLTRSPGRKPNVRPFQLSVAKRRNVAIKKTAPRFFPMFSHRNRCSRTEGVDESYVIRNRKPTYKSLLKGRQETFPARLYGADKSVEIPGSRILPSDKLKLDSFEKRAEEELSDKESDAERQSSGVSPQPTPKETFTSVGKSLLNPTQIIPSNVKPKQPEAATFSYVFGAVKGSTVVHIPPGSETKMMRWSLLQDSFLNNSLQMWLSSPESGTPRLYVTSNLKAPDVKCRNLRNWTGKTERGYPPLVSELMQQISDESASDKIRFGVMLRRKNYWEVIGIRRLPRPLQNNLISSSNNVKFLKDNAVMSVPLPAIRSACRWHVIYIDCHFDRIVFQGCVIIEKNIIQLCNGSKTLNCVNAILFKENFPEQSKSLGLPPIFGLYALPKIRECVFLGPFDLESSKGDVVSMFKDMTAKGKDSVTGRIFVEVVQPKSRSSWLYAEGLLEGKTVKYTNTISNPHAEPRAFRRTVALQGRLKMRAKESLIGKKLPAPIKPSYKTPIIIASSLKKKMMSSGFHRSRIGYIAAKKVAASKVFARRNFSASNHVDSTKPSAPEIAKKMPATPCPLKEKSPVSLLKVALSVSKDDCQLPVGCVVEEIITSPPDEIVTSPPDKIIGLSPIMPEKTKGLSPEKLNARIQSPPQVESQTELCSLKAICSPIQVTKHASEDISDAVISLCSPVVVDKDNPPPLSLLRRHSSIEFAHSRMPLVDYGSLAPRRLSTGVTSCSSASKVTAAMEKCAALTITTSMANRPGLTITERHSTKKAPAVGCLEMLDEDEQVVEESNSDNDVEFIPCSGPTIGDTDCDIMVVPKTWQPGTLPPVLAAAYEPAEINKTHVMDMFAAAVEGSTRVKYIPSIPSLGYVEAYRLPDNKTRIRFLNKAFIEVTVSTDSIRSYLDKSIRNNSLLLVEPPDLPLTWAATEDIESYPDVLPFNYMTTFDGNHMLCKNGLFRKKVTPKVMESRQGARDQDIIALERLKKVIGAPDIHGVSLEETFSQAAAEILQCKRLEQDLQYKRNWWTRRLKKVRKRYIRNVLSLPNKEDQAGWFEKMKAVFKPPSTDATSVEIIDLLNEINDSGNDPWLNRGVVDISEPGFSLAAFTPRRLEAILFPVNSKMPHAGGPGFPIPTRTAPKHYTGKHAVLNCQTTQPTRSDSLLRRNMYQPAPLVQSVIPLMDLTDDTAQPKVVLQKRPELPLVILDDDDDDQVPAPKQPRPSDKPKTVPIEKPRISYSYGINSAGHFFRCAIIGNRIVNKVRITKVPNNVECLRMIDQTNVATMQRKVAENASEPIVVTGTHKIGIRLVDACAPSNQEENKEVYVVGTPDALQSYGHVVGTVPIGKRLANTRVPVKSISVLNPVNPTMVGRKPGAAHIGVQLVNANRLDNGEQAVNKEVILATPPVSNALQSVGPTVPGSAPNIVGEEAVPETFFQVEGKVDVSNESEVLNARAVFDQLVSSGKLKENTRQIMIKGPLFTNTPNILKRAPIKITTGEIKNVHVELHPTRTSPASQPRRVIQTEKQLVKISAGELQRLNSIARKANTGTFVKLKLKKVSTQLKMNCETSDKSLENQSGSTGELAVKVGMGPSSPIVNLMPLLSSITDVDDSNNLVIDEDAHKGDLVIDEGLLSDTGVDVDPSDSILMTSEVAEIEENLDFMVQVDNAADAGVLEDLCDNKVKHDMNSSQPNPEIHRGNIVISQGSTVVICSESVANMDTAEILRPTLEETSEQQFRSASS